MDTQNKNYIQFLGAAGTVTGSKYLLAIDNFHILIDSGLFQGIKELRERNWNDIPFPASKIDAVILTHGHLDHTGYLPRLVNQGLDCPVYCTEPTADIAEVILKDSAKIQEEDAEHANKHKYTKHKPAKPLYDLKDVEKTLPLFSAQEPEKFIKLNNDIKFRFRKNAHILGASFIELDIKDKRFVFSGDIGRPNDPMLIHREKPDRADYLFVESTYGDRLHPKIETNEILKTIIDHSVNQNGPLFVASFAVDRAQDFMFEIWKLKQEGKIPNFPIYLDSPMGVDVSKLFLKYQNWLSLDKGKFKEIFNDVKMVSSIKETYRLANDETPKIVIAGSGMMNGGRILHYLEKHIGNPEATFVLPGYQALGTRGRRLSEGGHDIKIHGSFLIVKATIKHIKTMSSHADQNELLDWMANISNTPEKVFIIHGEPQSSDALRVKINHSYKWDCKIPKYFEKFILDI